MLELISGTSEFEIQVKLCKSLDLEKFRVKISGYCNLQKFYPTSWIFELGVLTLRKINPSLEIES